MPRRDGPARVAGGNSVVVPVGSSIHRFAMNVCPEVNKESVRNVEYLIGLLLAGGVVVFSALIGLDRERSFYVTTLIVVASYYALFAIMGGSGHALIVEILAGSVFFLFAAFGFKGNFWLVAVGLIGHGVFDFARRGLIENPGLPRWWPGFCAAFDVVFGGWLVVRLLQKMNFERKPELNP